MANPGFYNDNQFRDYPFVTRTEPLNLSFTQSGQYPDISGQYPGQVTEHLDHGFIVDLGIIMDLDAEYSDKSGHEVYLVQIRRDDTELLFTFHTNAPGGGTQELVFRREINATEFSISWEEASSFIAEEEDALRCDAVSKWRGFLATGDLTPWASRLADGEFVNYTQGLWRLEPARVQNLADSYMRGLNLANFPRVRAGVTDACTESSSAANEDARVQATCLSGPLVFKEGFNCGIRQDRRANALIIGAGVGLGAGEPCEEVEAYPGENKPGTSKFFSGGPACSEIIKSVNGITGRNITIVAGPGFRVYTEVDNPNQLVVDRALDDFALCLEDNDSIFSSFSLDGPPPPSVPAIPMLGVYYADVGISSSEFLGFGDVSDSASLDIEMVNEGTGSLDLTDIQIQYP